MSGQADSHATRDRPALVRAIRELRDEQWRQLRKLPMGGARSQNMGAIGAYTKVLTLMGVDPDE